MADNHRKGALRGRAVVDALTRALEGKVVSARHAILVEAAGCSLLVTPILEGGSRTIDLVVTTQSIGGIVDWEKAALRLLPVDGAPFGDRVRLSRAGRAVIRSLPVAEYRLSLVDPVECDAFEKDAAVFFAFREPERSERMPESWAHIQLCAACRRFEPKRSVAWLETAREIRGLRRIARQLSESVGVVLQAGGDILDRGASALTSALIDEPAIAATMDSRSEGAGSRARLRRWKIPDEDANVSIRLDVTRRDTHEADIAIAVEGLPSQFGTRILVSDAKTGQVSLQGSLAGFRSFRLRVGVWNIKLVATLEGTIFEWVIPLEIEAHKP